MNPALVPCLKAGLVIGLASLLIGGWAVYEVMAPRLELARQQAEDLGERIREQNTAIEGLKKAEEDRAELVRKTLALAERRRRDAETRAQQLLAEQLPAGSDECQAASALIRRELAK